MRPKWLLSAQLALTVAVLAVASGYAEDWYSEHPLFGVKAAVRVMNDQQLAAVTGYVNRARPVFDRDLERLHSAKQALLRALISGAENAPAREAYLAALDDLMRQRIELARQVFALLTPQQKTRLEHERAKTRAWGRLWAGADER